MKWLEPYAVFARLTPALLVIAPALNILLAFGKSESPVLVAVIGGATAVGLPIVLEGLVRDLGVKKQEQLWTKWGGSPTRQLLAPPAENHPDRTKREFWRSKLSSAADIKLSEADSESDRGAGYDLMTQRAIERTRNHERLLAENKRYGYQRNLLALQPFGVVAAVCSGAAAGIAVFVLDAPTTQLRVLVAAIAVSLVGFWVLMPSEKKVLEAGRRYATALLDAASHAD